ncbi:MAG: response regulator [Deltaproteobacteria bacterium]|nr:response regulator [Deltaproteobacteria bacterium]
MLKSLGFNVIEAQNEEQAVEAARNLKEKLDLILTDVVIPGIRAPALTVRLKKLHPEAKVLFMSGYTENAIAHYGIIYPGVNFIQKPFTVEEIGKKIVEVLKKD